MGHQYGYARVSTQAQSLEIQEKELKEAGCERIFSDKATGKNTDRPGFQLLLETVLRGDTVIIAKLDRIGRNLQDLVTIVNNFNDQDIGFIVLDNKAIDTRTSVGKMIFNVFASMAEYEHALILERTEAGRSAARARGRTGGRKSTIKQSTIDAVTKLAEDMEVGEACKQVGISRQSYYRLK